MVLYINACVRKESRTDRIARALLTTLGDFEELKLSELDLNTLDEDRLEARTNLIEKGELENPEFELARKFAEADIIVISAPFWDLSFPSELKVFIENIYITGIVSKYNEQGQPVGLCKAEKLYYVTTSGGPYCETYSYGYIRDLAINYFGIKETELIKAEMLDVYGYDAEKIVKETILLISENKI